MLLLEAGRDASRDLKVRIPAMLIKVLRSDVDWNFETEPCKKLNDHSVYLCRGKTLGGSTTAVSLINLRQDAGMIATTAGATPYVLTPTEVGTLYLSCSVGGEELGSLQEV